MAGPGGEQVAAEPQLQLSMKAIVPGSSMELACVGSLQLQQEQQLTFMCGSLLVPTGTSTGTISAPAVVPSQRMSAPRYRRFSTQTDLNSPPSQGSHFEQFVVAPHDPGGLSKRGGGQSLSSLALSAFLDYGDKIDIVGPVDILKQIFKTPYSKARLSVGVHRIGQTLVLCSGPETEESEKAARRKKKQGNGVESNLFAKFVQHLASGHTSDSRAQPRAAETTSGLGQASQRSSGEAEVDSSVEVNLCFPWQLVQDQTADDEIKADREGFCSSYQAPVHKSGQQSVSWQHHRRESGMNSLNDFMPFGDQQQDTEYLPNEPDGHPRPGTERFLRVLFWEFEHMRMMLGSDLLVFSNEKHGPVSLHLLELDRQVSPLVWLDAWLDNVMASVPELAVFYHEKGVVQGYQILKTEEILLYKGLAEDGTVSFHPHVVQQNASSILRFLQDNCKQDPGSYWLFKNAGEDLLHLFDLAAISKSRSSRAESDSTKCGTLPTGRKISKGRYSLPLAMLLYRLAYSFSHSQNPDDQGKCASLFEKCLEFMDEQEPLVVRSSAHEHVGRVMLNCLKELGLPLHPLLLGKIAAGSKQFPLVLPSSQTVIQDADIEDHHVCELRESEQCMLPDVPSNAGEGDASCSVGLSSPPDRALNFCGDSIDTAKTLVVSAYTESNDASESSSDSSSDVQSCGRPEDILESGLSDTHAGSRRDITVPSIPSNPLVVASIALTAVHHISQAIKALRWQRKLEDVGTKGSSGADDKVCLSCNFSGQAKGHQQMTVCVCGDIDCIPLCDIRDVELGYRMDHKLWRLVLLLGESYLALGRAYKDAGELALALRAAELACLIRSCIPQRSVEVNLKLETQSKGGASNGCRRSKSKNKCMEKQADSDTFLDEIALQERPGKGLFWGQLWMFIGDVFVERQRRSASLPDVSAQRETQAPGELKVIQDVAKEVKRLKKRMDLSKRNCSLCSLTSCTCQSDRVESGNSASCSSSIKREVPRFSSRAGKRAGAKNRKPRDSPGRTEDNKSNCEQIVRDAHEVHHSSDGRILDKSDNPCKSSSKLDVPSQKDDNLPLICASVGDMSSYLRRPMTDDWESNLLASVDCYRSAVLAFQGYSECDKERENAFRKKGWAANELGRKRLQLGNVKSAEESFQVAVEAFVEVKDFTNVVLVHCNLGHAHRASAENVVLQLTHWEQSNSPLQQSILPQAVDHAKTLYLESLREYNLARQELNKARDHIEVGLRNEVHTQLGHTYLKLGMLLSKEEKLTYDGTKSAVQPHSFELPKADISRDSKDSGKKSSLSARDMITKALVLYQSLGDLRLQEAAFAQFQLACHERDCCIRSMASQGAQHVHPKAEGASLQAGKRHASLAELYWEKALEFYRPNTHCDMFLEILMQRSALCLHMAPLTHPNPVLDMAFTHLLEGRRCASKSGDTEGRRGQPVYTTFVDQLRAVLKKMLAVAIKHSGSNSTRSTDSITGGASVTTPRGGANVIKVKEVYRHALEKEPDFQTLYTLWTTN